VLLCLVAPASWQPQPLQPSWGWLSVWGSGVLACGGRDAMVCGEGLGFRVEGRIRSTLTH
jgi:hypothetical protein